MTFNSVTSPEYIEKAVEALRRLRPAYEGLLKFYGEVFIAQEDSLRNIQLEPVQIPENILSVKLKEELPLIQASDFMIDEEESEKLLIRLCRIALDSNEIMADSANKILSALENSKIDPKIIFKHLLDGNNAYLEKTAKETDIEGEVLAFLAYSSIKPSTTVCSNQLSNYLKSGKRQGKGYCPVCGNTPGLSTLEDEGRRFLYCGFCWHKWGVQRIFCPFCEDEGKESQKYFYSEEEEEYRVDTCDRCKRYIKTIDVRKMDRIFFPPLEQAATLHLDMKAEEMGLENPIHQFFK